MILYISCNTQDEWQGAVVQNCTPESEDRCRIDWEAILESHVAELIAVSRCSSCSDDSV